MKYLFFALGFFLLGSVAFAQSESEAVANNALSAGDIYARKAIKEGTYKQLYRGFRIGTTLAGLGGDDSNSTSNKVGMLIGGFVGMDINPNITWQAGLSYVKKGAKIDSEVLIIGLNPIAGSPLNVNYNYLSLPAHVRYFFSEKNGFFLQGGLSANLLLKAEAVGIGDDFAIQEGRIDVKDQINSIDFGIQIGLGYEWTQMLEIALMYEHGAANTLGANPQNLRINNRGWQFALGFKF